MEKVKDLIKVYKAKTNMELYNISLEIETYTPEAKVAFGIVVKERGGMHSIQEEHKLNLNKEKERRRIKKEILEAIELEDSKEVIFSSIESDIFSHKEKEKVLEEIYNGLLEENRNEKISIKTIFFGIIGGTISSLIGGVSLGAMMIVSNVIHYFIVFLFAFLNYLLISGFTKKNIKNPVVIVLTVVFTVVTILISRFVYDNSVYFENLYNQFFI